VGPYLRVKIVQKSTVTDSGCVRPEELDGDARAHLGGRGMPGAA
jgi:hypothetical protein